MSTDAAPSSDATSPDEADLTAADIAWNLDTLIEGTDVDALMDRSDELTEQIAEYRGRVAELDADGMAAAMHLMADLQEAQGRAGYYAMLRFSEDTADPERGALMMRVQERSTALATQLVFFELEWAAVDESHVDALLADPVLDFCAHHLRSMRRYRDHLLSEPEEQLLTEKSVSGAGAWVRLFDEQTSAITVDLPASLLGGEGDDRTTVPLEAGLSMLQHPDREVRRAAADAVTAGLEPGLRTRGVRLQHPAARQVRRRPPAPLPDLDLRAEPVQRSLRRVRPGARRRGRRPLRHRPALVLAQGPGARAGPTGRLRPHGLGGRGRAAHRLGRGQATSCSTPTAASRRSWRTSRSASSTSEWIDAPTRPGKRPGAFCAYTVPSHHPYVLLNWTEQAPRRATLAHELGHGLHAYLAREQGVFHQSTPLTLAETASVFGETVANDALLTQLEDPGARFALLASTLEDSIATVFRQVAMNRFEDPVHTARRGEGELSVDRFNELWDETARPRCSVTRSRSPRATGPGGATSRTSSARPATSTPTPTASCSRCRCTARYTERGDEFVPLLPRAADAGGSLPPDELGRIVDCDLEDPGFWDAGLDIVERQLDAATEAAHAAGRI